MGVFMKRTIRNTALLLATVVAFFSLSCSSSRDRLSLTKDSSFLLKENQKLGTYAQQNGLWQEALYRWQRVTALAPSDWQSQNNLAVAYEALGRLKEAEAAYSKALKLSNEDQYVRRNYDEFQSLRNKKFQEEPPEGKGKGPKKDPPPPDR